MVDMAKTAAFSMLLGASGVITLYGLAYGIGMLGGGGVGFWIVMGPAHALAPMFSFLTSLLPLSFVVGLVGKSSVGSSLALAVIWSLLFWFVLFCVIAFVVLRLRASRRSA